MSALSIFCLFVKFESLTVMKFTVNPSVSCPYMNNKLILGSLLFLISYYIINCKSQLDKILEESFRA